MKTYYSILHKWIDANKLKKFKVKGDSINGIIEAFSLEHAEELINNPTTLNHLITVGYLHRTGNSNKIKSVTPAPDNTVINFY